MIPAVASGRRRSTVSPGTPPMSDTFPGSSLDLTKWPSSYGAYSVTGGRLRTPCTSSYPAVISGYLFDVTAYPLYIEVPTLPVAGTGTTQTQFLIGNSSGSGGFEINGAPLNLRMFGTSVSTTNLTYSATDHRWLRLSVVGGNWVFETSPDKATWTARRTVAAPTWLTASLLRVTLSSGYYGTESAPGYTEFDNFNV